MNNYIKHLIEGGENQQLDFKFEIADSRKIARTLVAFANTDGGHLLVGVKDNGAVAGVRSDEEFFMAEGAARMYCRPEVPFEVRDWNVDGRRVLEIIIPKSDQRPHRQNQSRHLGSALRPARRVVFVSIVAIRGVNPITAST